MSGITFSMQRESAQAWRFYTIAAKDATLPSIYSPLGPRLPLLEDEGFVPDDSKSSIHPKFSFLNTSLLKMDIPCHDFLLAGLSLSHPGSLRCKCNVWEVGDVRIIFISYSKSDLQKTLVLKRNLRTPSTDISNLSLWDPQHASYSF